MGYFLRTLNRSKGVYLVLYKTYWHDIVYIPMEMATLCDKTRPCVVTKTATLCDKTRPQTILNLHTNISRV